MEFIAAYAGAIEIGAAFLAAIAISAVAFYLHIRLLERGVQRRQADLRAQRAQAAAPAPVVADRPHIAMLRAVPSHGRWVETGQASTAHDATAEPPAERPAPPRVAAR